MNDLDHDLPTPAPSGDSLPFDAPVQDASAAAGGLDKIRDLLFGRELSDVDKRFARLEARLAEDAAALREEVTGRLEALEAYVKDELSSLNAGLGQEPCKWKSHMTDQISVVASFDIDDPIVYRVFINC